MEAKRIEKRLRRALDDIHAAANYLEERGLIQQMKRADEAADRAEDLANWLGDL